MIKVCKFGGTSMSDGMNFRRVADIMNGDSDRRFLVVSAPGKRFGNDSKVTDLLYAAHDALEAGGDFRAAFKKVRDRFSGIVREIGLAFKIDSVLDECEREIEAEKSRDFTASRGEYLSARIMAGLLNVPFIDARDTVRFFEDGRLNDKETFALVKEAIRGKRRAVVSGFYGACPNGKVKTFSRGGSGLIRELDGRKRFSRLRSADRRESRADPRALLSGAQGAFVYGRKRFT
jgi:aspartate kinase